MHYDPVAGPAAWRGKDVAGWQREFSAAEIAEIEAAVDAYRGDPAALSPANFSLPTLGPALRAILKELLEGRGFILLRGLPVQSWSREQQALAYLGIGAWLGRFCSQNAKGHLLGHVKDLGLDIRDPNVRYYQTNRKLEYHTDSVDIVGLLCLQPAKAGGESYIASSIDRLQRNPAPPPGPDAGAVRAVPHRSARRGAGGHEALVRHPDLPLARRTPVVHLRAPVHRVGAESFFPKRAGSRARRSRPWI